MRCRSRCRRSRRAITRATSPASTAISKACATTLRRARRGGARRCARAAPLPAAVRRRRAADAAALRRDVRGDGRAGLRAPLPRRAQRTAGRLRIGYLSADLRNHVMGKMMYQAIAHHDREPLRRAPLRDVGRCATSGPSASWRSPTRSCRSPALDDAAAVARIAADDLDILVDLNTHTSGARPALLARKPARVQITHVASAGTLGMRTIDFKLTDRYADVPESQDRPARAAARRWKAACTRIGRSPRRRATRYTRAALGIAADAFVIGAFVNPLKLSRRTLDAVARGAGARAARGDRVLAARRRAARGLSPRRARAAASTRRVSCSCPQGATRPRTRRATPSSMPCSTRCRSAASTARSRRSTPACRWSPSSGVGMASARRTRSSSTSA